MLLGHLRSLRYSSSGHGKLVVSLILCLCSALSKEIGITAVAVFVMYEFFILNKVESHCSLP